MRGRALPLKMAGRFKVPGGSAEEPNSPSGTAAALVVEQMGIFFSAVFGSSLSSFQHPWSASLFVFSLYSRALRH